MPRGGRKPGAKNKFRNCPVSHDGFNFPSKLEGKRYLELKMQRNHGIIRGFTLQPAITLGTHLNRCRPDFLVFPNDGLPWYEDVKGRELATFKKTKQLWAAFGPRGIELRVVKWKNNRLQTTEVVVGGSSAPVTAADDDGGTGGPAVDLP